MRKIFGVLLIVLLVSFGQAQKKAGPHPDYVPDAKTAQRIAEAVLIGQFGEQRVNGQMPLLAQSTSKDLWLVQGHLKDIKGPGGNFGVWVIKHDASVKIMERMK
jgi:hypothetical protein